MSCRRLHSCPSLLIRTMFALSADRWEFVHEVILFNSFASGIGRLSCSSCWTTRWVKSCRPISSCTLRILGTCGHGKGSVTMGMVAFILCWCRYSEQSGRESVIEFLVIVFKKFPEVFVIAVGEGRRRGRSSWACDG